MEKRTFSVPTGDLGSRLMPYILLAGTWALASAVAIFGSNTPPTLHGLRGIILAIVLASLFVMYLNFGEAALSYAVLVDENELIQLPWLGSPRLIKWGEVDRIQALDLEGSRGSRIYRIRVFSRSTVIVFNNRFTNCYDLVKILQEKADQLSIPVYREEAIGTVRWVFGSWSVDSSGKSAGIPVSSIAVIPTP